MKPGAPRSQLPSRDWARRFAAGFRPCAAVHEDSGTAVGHDREPVALAEGRMRARVLTRRFGDDGRVVDQPATRPCQLPSLQPDSRAKHSETRSGMPTSPVLASHTVASRTIMPSRSRTSVPALQ